MVAKFSFDYLFLFLEETKMNNITSQFESLPSWAKLIIIIVANALFCLVYRILRYTETKNTTTLVAGILCLIPVVGFVLAVLDVVGEITDNKVKYFAA